MYLMWYSYKTKVDEIILSICIFVIFKFFQCQEIFLEVTNYFHKHQIIFYLFRLKSMREHLSRMMILASTIWKLKTINKILDQFNQFLFFGRFFYV